MFHQLWRIFAKINTFVPARRLYVASESFPWNLWLNSWNRVVASSNRKWVGSNPLENLLLFEMIWMPCIQFAPKGRYIFGLAPVFNHPSSSGLQLACKVGEWKYQVVFLIHLMLFCANGSINIRIIGLNILCFNLIQFNLFATDMTAPITFSKGRCGLNRDSSKLDLANLYNTFLHNISNTKIACHLVNYLVIPCSFSPIILFPCLH